MYTDNPIKCGREPLKGEENSEACCKMSQPWRHCAKWNKSAREGQILDSPTYRRWDSGAPKEKGESEQSWKKKELGLNGYDSVLYKEKSAMNGKGWWNPNNVDVLLKCSLENG